MSLTSLVLVFAATTANPLDVGVAYQMDGRITKTKDENGDSEKRFQVTLFADSEAADGGAQTAYWTLTEDGRGEAPWLERFGGCNPFESEDGPALYYLRDEGLSIASLPPLALRGKTDLQLGAKWSSGSRIFQVVGESTVDEQPCWKIESRDAVGRRRNMKVLKDSGLAVRMEQVLFRL